MPRGRRSAIVTGGAVVMAALACANRGSAPGARAEPEAGVPGAVGAGTRSPPRSPGPSSLPTSPPPPPPPEPAVRVPDGAPATAAIAIASFDCFTLEDAPTGEGGGAGSSGPGISSWKGGGPAGAGWNTADLVCAAAIRTTCQDGDVASNLRVGKALLAGQSAVIRNGGVESRFVLRQSQWKKHLDEVTSPKGELYRTAVFRITASLTCRAPYPLRPGLGPRQEFTAERMFVAGFAEGE